MKAQRNTFAMAGQNQFTEDIAKRKTNDKGNPLEMRKKW